MADMPCRRARGRFLIHQNTWQPTMKTNTATRNRHHRYTLFTGILLWCLMQPGGVMAESGETIALPAPDRSGIRPLETLLHQRRSVREFSSEPLTLGEVGQLLWAAQGVVDAIKSHLASGEPGLGAAFEAEVARRFERELEPMLDELHPDWRHADQDVDERPEWLGDVVDALGGRIMQEINSAAAVTPISLLAYVLLATPKQKIGADELVRQLRLSLDLLKRFRD